MPFENWIEEVYKELGNHPPLSTDLQADVIRNYWFGFTPEYQATLIENKHIGENM